MLQGRYQIEQELGIGAHGKVYRGLDTSTQTPVAIKHLRPDVVQHDPDILIRFQREAEALRQLNHPNIVHVLDSFAEGSDHYIIMEYLAGGSLRNLLDQTPCMPLEQVLLLALDLSDALIRAHRLDVIHRDLKPANLLLTEDGTLKLTDFGVAHVGGQQRMTGVDVIVGTINYLSPEALNGERQDTRADIWAFGVLLFEMMAGEHPFAGETLTDTLMKIATTPVPDLEMLCPDAPVALVDLIYRMLEKDPSARIPSVRHVGAGLEDILQNRNITLHADNQFDTPVSRPLNRVKHNLPAQTTPFVGREIELTEIARLLENTNTRLVTLLAPGGMGKTRLALEAARSQLSRFDQRVYFVALAPITSPDFIIPTIAEAVDFQFYPGSDPKQQLLDFFREKKLLLTLDNFEHVLDGAGIVSDILAYAPGVKVLATSRERLNLSGEILFALGGMDYPQWETPENALEFMAVKLFMQSVRRVRPDFELMDNDLTYLAHICALVAGMPLGIVLAAAWVEVLSLKEVVDEIVQSLDFLETELRDVPERQRSIRGVFEYSWNRLSEQERAVFRQLSIFRGGFTREAAQEVAGASLKTLIALVNKSLLRRDVTSGRYDIHELLRQYAEKQLMSVAGEFEDTGERHMLHYVNFMEKRSGLLRSRQAKAAADEIEGDIDNVRLAWQFAVKFGRTTAIGTLARVFWSFFDQRNRQKEAIELLEQAVTALTSPTAIVNPDLELALGLVLSVQGSFYMGDNAPGTGESLLHKGLEILRRHNDGEPTMIALIGLSLSSMFLNKVEEGKQFAQELVSVAMLTGNPGHIAGALYEQGVFYHMAHEYEEAQRTGERALKYADEADDPFMQGICAGFLLADIAKDMGHLEQSKKYFLRGMTYFEEADRTFYIAMCRRRLVSILAASHDFEQAHHYLQQALQFFTQNGIAYQAGASLMDAAFLFDAQGQSERAVELLALLVTHPVLVEVDLVTVRNLLANLQSRLLPNIYTDAFERGRGRDLNETARELLAEGTGNPDN